MVYQWLTNNS